MPSATQIRKERIEVLLAKCERMLPSNIEIIDPIYWKARALFPTVRPKTCKSYAEAVFAIIRRKSKSL